MPVNRAHNKVDIVVAKMFLSKHLNVCLKIHISDYVVNIYIVTATEHDERGNKLFLKNIKIRANTKHHVILSTTNYSLLF